MKKLFLILTFINLTFGMDYESWATAQNEEFNEYKKTIDEEFTSMLKKEWKSFKTTYNEPAYEKPKPIEIPKIEKELKIPKKELNKSKIIPDKKIKILDKNIVIKKFKKIENFEELNLNFYSTNIQVQYDSKTYTHIKDVSNDSISKYWEHMNKTNYNSLINQINTHGQTLQFNDWAKYLLTYKIGFEIYKEENLTNLFCWFILSKMGYDVKIGYNNSTIYLLSSVEQKLYQVSYFNMKNSAYYVLNPKGRVNKINNIYTYKGKYPNSNKKLDMQFSKPIKLFGNEQNRKLSFVYDSNKYEINTKYSQNLIDFYKTFPQSQYNIYFNNVSNVLANTLLNDIYPLIRNKTELEAVNILLRFVQTSFKYKTDYNQFSYEKVFFAEETFYYEYSDCEDRTILFNFLVKELLGLNVVAIKFSNHLASAVEFSSEIKGDSFIFQNKKYTIADPTYINANVGMTMPKYTNSKFQVIK